MVPFFLLALSLGLASADQCAEDTAACKVLEWDSHSEAPLPYLRCRASGAWKKCLQAVTSCGDDGVDFTEVDAERTKCLVTDKQECTKKQEACSAVWKPKYDVSTVADWKCSKAAGWHSCLSSPEVFYYCGATILQEIVDIRDEACFNKLVV